MGREGAAANEFQAHSPPVEPHILGLSHVCSRNIVETACMYKPTHPKYLQSSALVFQHPIIYGLFNSKTLDSEVFGPTDAQGKDPAKRVCQDPTVSAAHGGLDPSI